MTIKLTYFDFDGSRGAECRLALHLGGAEFEDNRLSTPWPDHKPHTPYGSLPVLEVDGEELGQTNAILAWVGRTYGVHPTDLWQAAQHEALMSYSEELRERIGGTLRVKEPEEERLRVRTELANVTLQTWARNIEAQIGEGPFLAGAECMVADIKIYVVARWFTRGIVDDVPTDVFKAFPKLMALHDAVENHPRIRDWYAQKAAS